MEKYKFEIIGDNDFGNPIYLITDNFTKLLSDNKIHSTASIFRNSTPADKKLHKLFMKMLKINKIVLKDATPYDFVLDGDKWLFSEIENIK
jgi:hypothetical protein